jgi:hypothetical protein
MDESGINEFVCPGCRSKFGKLADFQRHAMKVKECTKFHDSFGGTSTRAKRTAALRASGGTDRGVIRGKQPVSAIE